jgi:tRNA-Thr(GGU) m(6)t(6)A37 methyltransferase TsaA
MIFEITPIAFVESCYKEKFATPRQSGLVIEAKGRIVFIPPYNSPDAVAGLENCSHIWLEFIFHQCIDQGWKKKVRPPRLGGNEKMGVFATRATHRPNGLGLSAVKLDGIEYKTEKGEGSVILNVSGLDLIEGTPIIDVKPYIPYSDKVEDAKYPFAQHKPNVVKVVFSEQAKRDLIKKNEDAKLIEHVLALDPKPAFHNIDNERIYGANLNNSNVTWHYLSVDNEVLIEVLGLN